MTGPDPSDLDRSRFRGALLGLAAGDAVGTTVEFSPPGSFEPVTDMVGGGPFGLEPGQWTDDTSMALCLAESLVDRQGFDPADQVRRYVAWWRHGHLSSTGDCFDIGSTTAGALHRFIATGKPLADPSEVDQAQAANGSLMRLAPVPLRWAADVAAAAEMAGESSRPTHPADRPVDSCRVLGAMIAAAVGGASPDEVLDPGFWQWGPLDPEVEAVTRGSWRAKEPPQIRGTGFCVDALEAALWAVGGAGSFEEAVLRAVNLGDDADTTGAICGQLAGALWGDDAIPGGWRDRLCLRERIESLADRLWVAATGAGEPGWGFDDLLHAWWVEPGLLLAGEYPGDPDPDAARRKLDVLVDSGIRRFIDLTTDHDRLAPYGPSLAELAGVRDLDVQVVAHPVPDMGVVGREGYQRILDRLAGFARQDLPTYVHCWGGRGRTSTVVGCHLVTQGLTGQQALDRLVSLRDGTRKAHVEVPESDEQRRVVLEW